MASPIKCVLLEKKTAGGGGGGIASNTITITFEAAFVGQEYVVSDGSDTITGTVPDTLTVSVQAVNCNSTYTIKATANNGVEYSTTVTTGDYYGQYNATLTVFSATIYVTAVANAQVTAVRESNTYTATAGSDGIAAIEVLQTGNYNINAIYAGVSSSTATVEVREDETSYTTTVQFAILNIKTPPGSLLIIRKKEA